MEQDKSIYLKELSTIEELVHTKSDQEREHIKLEQLKEGMGRGFQKLLNEKNMIMQCYSQLKQQMEEHT